MSGTSIRIRPARFEDMAAVGEVVVQSWQHTFKGLLPQVFLSSLTRDAQQHRHEQSFAHSGVHYRVAENANEVVGFASGGPGRDPEFTVQNELYAIYLMPGFERQGIGRRLFHSVTLGLARSERDGLYVTVLAVNPNRVFYARLGGAEMDGPSLQLGNHHYPQVVFWWEKLPAIANTERE